MSHIAADRPIRWGFLGAGGVAASMAADLHHGNDMLYAVAARDADRADAFAARFGASHSHGVQHVVAVMEVSSHRGGNTTGAQESPSDRTVGCNVGHVRSLCLGACVRAHVDS